jgi:branched-chain amino acid transport system substrate-binding protein
MAHATDPIRVAAIFARTGLAAADNIANYQAARLAVKEINEAGGLLGRPVRLLELDNQSTPLGARLAALRAADMGVTAVVGASWSTHSLAMAPILQEAGIPMISPESSSPRLTEVGDFIFRVCFTDMFQGRMAAQFAVRELGAKTAVVLVNVNEEYSLTLSRYFTEYFRKFDSHVLWEGNYKGDAVDFSDLLAQVEIYRPDVIFLPGYGRDSGLIIKQATRMGIESIFIGGDGWTEQVADYAGETLTGSYYCANWHPAVPYTRSAHLMEAYQAAYGQPIRNTAVPLTYDAVRLLADAIGRAGTADPPAVRDALAATRNFMSATGRITMDENGDPRGKEVAFLRYENGAWWLVKVVSPHRGYLPVAAIFAFTGPAAEENFHSVRGVRFGVEEVNRRGGVLDRELRLIEIDNRSTPIGSKVAADEALEREVVAILGADWSSHSLAIAKVAQAGGVPMISNISTHPRVTRVGDYIFRVCFTDRFAGRVMARFARKRLGLESAVVFVDLTSDYSLGLAETFSQSFTFFGGHILEQLSYKHRQGRFDPLAARATALSPQALYIPGHSESGAIIKAVMSREPRPRPVFLGGDGWGTTPFYDNGGHLTPEGYYCTHWSEAIERQKSVEFVQRYGQRGDLRSSEALGFDAVLLLADAIDRAGVVDGPALRDALAATRGFEGVTGTLSFDENGDPIKGGVIMKVEKGRTAFLTWVHPEDAAP